MAVRLVLRSLRPGDVPALLEWMPDRSMYKYWGKSAGKSDKDPSLLFAHTEKPSKSFHWGIEYEGKVVGELWIYLIENDRMAKLAELHSLYSKLVNGGSMHFSSKSGSSSMTPEEVPAYRIFGQ